MTWELNFVKMIAATKDHSVYGRKIHSHHDLLIHYGPQYHTSKRRRPIAPSFVIFKARVKARVKAIDLGTWTGEGVSQVCVDFTCSMWISNGRVLDLNPRPLAKATSTASKKTCNGRAVPNHHEQ